MYPSRGPPGLFKTGNLEGIIISAQHVLWAGRLIDNASPQPIANAALVIKDGIIQQVIADFDPGQLGCAAELTDLREYTILPGLIDCHVHLGLDGLDFKESLSRWDNPGAWLPQVEKELTVSRNCGIVAVRDGGDQGQIGLKAKGLLEAGKLTGPMILSCGQAISKQGFYGSFLGPGIHNLTAAMELVDYNFEQGADWIKVIVSGIVSFREFGKVGNLHFSQQELNRIVSYAQAKGLPVMAHASSDEAVIQAVRAGVDSIEHGYFVSTNSLAAMADKDIPWVPTVVPVACQEQGSESETREIIRRTYQLQLERIAQAHSLGVTIGIGTDAGAAGVCHGTAYWQELALLSSAGLSNDEVIKAATLNSARICGLDRQLGSLEPGKSACVVAVKGDPLQDLTLLQKK